MNPTRFASARRMLLIRHAESMANVGAATTGVESIGLSPLGQLQAERLAKSLAIDGPCRLVSSPFLRAQLTAAPLAKSLRAVIEELPIQEFTYLAEPPRPTTPAERRAEIEKYWKAADPQAMADGPYRESFAGFVARVHAFLDWSRAQEAPVIVAVTHGLFLHALMRACQQSLPATAESMAWMNSTFKATDYPNAGCHAFELDAEQRWIRS